MRELTGQGIFELPDADIRFYPNFLGQTAADHYFKELRHNVPWRQDNIRVFGKTYPQPRLTALYGDNGKAYAYSNITMKPLPLTPELLQLKSLTEAHAPVTFTTCLLNRYRNGRDSNGWHADNEKELGRNPVIASISLGASRYFHLKHNTLPTEGYKLKLTHGSLLLMMGPTQHFWKHQIPKTARPVGERINLTFRVLA